MQKENSKKISLIVGVIVLMGLSFYGGDKYAAAKSTGMQASARAAFAGGAGRGGRTGGGFGGLTMGQVLSKDAQSITVSLQGGGSKIIFYGNTTTVAKTVAGTIDDLAIGKEVVINGTANSDGSVSATSIQIRPNNPPKTTPTTTTSGSVVQ